MEWTSISKWEGGYYASVQQAWDGMTTRGNVLLDIFDERVARQVRDLDAALGDMALDDFWPDSCHIDDSSAHPLINR